MLLLTILIPLIDKDNLINICLHLQIKNIYIYLMQGGEFGIDWYLMVDVACRGLELASLKNSKPIVNTIEVKKTDNTQSVLFNLMFAEIVKGVSNGELVSSFA